ncbi:MAG: glycosyltransferase [Candidatus Moranbacteria bacterium]|nr:glycosyltransferase [Candidatus Moranbacteria bacterium]
MIKYSFIIPVKEINGYIRQGVPEILKMERDDFEILIYPDEITEETWPKTRQIATGRAGPAQKRNLALRDARGEILILIDDDAYPKKNFIDILDADFQDESIVAVGGPAITPKESKFRERVSGASFLSSLSGGFPERYRSVGKKKLVADWPSVNLSIRKNIFAEIGGFACEFWPGEDTKLCHDLLLRKNFRILHDPGLVVYHHRREGLWKHVRQVSAYGLHRGYFAKKYAATSRRWKYFLPSAFVLFVVLGAIASLLIPEFIYFYVFGWAVYLVALVNAFIDIYSHEKDLLITLATSYYIFLTHIFYGIRFIQGFVFTRELKSKLR